MKFTLLILLTLILNDPIKISKINSAKSEAKKAFQSGDYKTAAAKYAYLVDSLGVKEDEVLLNLAHAYYLQKDTSNAFSKYQSVTNSSKRDVSSKANQQLGLITNQQGKAQEALNYFKQAVKADPTNDAARYNYEMLKKKLDEKKKQDQQQNQQNKDQQNKEQEKQNKDQQKKDEQQNEKDKKEQENKEQQNKENQEQQKDQQQKDEKNEKDQKDQKENKEQSKEEKEQQEKNQQKKDQLDKGKLEQMNITEEKARMILEAMKNQEKQYLQQNKRKATKSKDRSKPDW